MEAQGIRKVVEMPNGERWYVLAFPHAQQDHFVVKMPYENRAENRKTRQAMDSIMEVLNQHVEGIHDHYTEAIDGWREEAEALLKAVDGGGAEAVEVFGSDVMRRMVESMRAF